MKKANKNKCNWRNVSVCVARAQVINVCHELIKVMKLIFNLYRTMHVCIYVCMHTYMHT